MSSAARSPRPIEPARRAAPDAPPEVLSGPVAVCVDRPILSLDRPFTYELPEDLGAGVGSLVRLRFHGKLTRGWVLGSTSDVPPRVLRVDRLVSPVRFFDPPMLEVLRWVSERYVAPLAAVIARSHPPRVASEEDALGGGVVGSGSPTPRAHATEVHPGVAVGGSDDVLAGYRNGGSLLTALRGGAGSFVVRPAPGDEAALAVACVRAALEGGRSAVVLVPELDPLPATARAVLEAAGDRGVLFAGGDRRARYRTWLEIAGGRYLVVVGTRPAVFAPVPDPGLVLVSRESHALHREERAPYYHVRDVAIARARAASGVCVMSSPFPSLEAAVGAHVRVEPQRRRWPPVEVVRPGPEGRAPRLVAALRTARRAFLYEPLPGYGVARVCRACSEPASCAACGGVLRLQEGEVRCAVCGTAGRCASCGARDFGIVRGGAERVEEWARAIATVPVRRVGAGEEPRPPGDAEAMVGGVEAVKEFDPPAVDLVCILDADLASRRPGLAARERAVATWFEVAAWAGTRGRVIVQTRHPNDPAVQALVTGRPERFVRAELPRREAAGFPVGFPVFRVAGTAELEGRLRSLPLRTLLASSLGDQTVCLAALDPGDVAAFGRAMRELSERGVVTRVEAEPHL
jgi:primosomal protein N' (replication factor Y)